MRKSVNKVKRIEKNNMTFLEIKSVKGQQLDLTQVEAVTKGKVESLLPLTVKDGRKFTLIYNITGMMSLKEYLANTVLTKQHFGFLLQNIFDIWNTLKDNFFQHTSLLLSLGRVKVDPSTKRLYFVYVPIQKYDNETTLKDFLLKILDVACFDPKEDLGFVQEYIRILNTGVNFSIFDLGQYIVSLNPDKTTERQTRIKKCPICGHTVSAEANSCTNCKYSFVKNRTGSLGEDKKYYNPFDDNKSGKNEKFFTGEELDVNSNLGTSKEQGYTDSISSDYETIDHYGEKGKKESEHKSNVGTGTTVLNDECSCDPETTVLNYKKTEVKKGYITRVATKETKHINKPVYNIGRGTVNDFIVVDNTAVGRRHAIITNQDERFYIEDLNSVNKSYINGKMIMPEEKVEIFDRAKITLANENFIFSIKVVEE